MSNEEEILDSMPKEDMEYSVASQLSYDYYDNSNDAEKIQKALDTYLENYTFDPEYSNDNASTFVRPDGSAILAFRGTRPTNLSDLNADASILAGQHRTNTPNPRFIEAQNHYNFVKNKYDNLDLTGHSLGGTIGEYIGRTNDEKAVVFNAGETIFSLTSIPKSNTSKSIVYRTNTFDTVSFANSLYSHANKIRVVPQTDSLNTWFGSHNITNFLPSQDMLPLSNEPDIIIPSKEFSSLEIIKKPTVSQQQLIEDICLKQPDLFQCKKIKLKNKKNKLVI